jgi:hypothetical protein
MLEDVVTAADVMDEKSGSFQRPQQDAWFDGGQPRWH